MKWAGGRVFGAYGRMKVIMNKFFRGSERQKRGLRVGVVGFIGNMVLFASKVLVGIWSGSIAVIADSINNILDSTSSVITIFGFRYAGKKGDPKHPHGHGRIEYIAAFVIAIIIVVTALLLGYASVQRIIQPTPVDASVVSIVIIALAIAGKGLLAAYYYFQNRRIQSEMLAASGRDSISDMLATSITLLTLIIAPLTNFPIDGVAGLVISLFIFFLGGKTFFKNLHLLIGHRPDHKMLREIRKIVLSQEAFSKIDELDFHDYGPENREVLVRVRLAPQMTKYKIERDIDSVKRELAEKFAVEAVIYWPPRG